MSKANPIYISKQADPTLISYLRQKGCQLSFIESQDIVDESLSHHPDIFLCKMGILPNSPVFFADGSQLGKGYPEDVAYNAACTGKYFIHNLSYTAPALLQAAKEMDMIFVDVKQGYTKCSIIPVSEDAIITYDQGITSVCQSYGMEVLTVSPGFVRLDGYDTGFIGGTCGLIDKELVFNGDLYRHPDCQRIVDFAASKGITCKWFADYPLTDIGSIL